MIQAMPTEATSAGNLVDLIGMYARHEHKLVITTYVGVKRCHGIDVLRQTGLQCIPLHRKNIPLSIVFDKTNGPSYSPSNSAEHTGHACE